MIDYVLPIFYRVGQTCFSEQQIREMVARTNSKLAETGIEIYINKLEHIDGTRFAYVSQASKEAELRELLETDSHPGPNKTLRVFLVKVDLDSFLGSWTYDPIADDKWQGAIFITELFNDSSDEAYETQFYLSSNDTLLHELGHVLMQEADHFQGQERNFFHELAEQTDDSITAEQIKRMRGEDIGRPAGAPIYVRAKGQG